MNKLRPVSPLGKGVAVAFYPTVIGCLYGKGDMIVLSGCLFSFVFWAFFIIARMEWLNREIATLSRENISLIAELPPWNRMVFSVWVWDIAKFLPKKEA